MYIFLELSKDTDGIDTKGVQKRNLKRVNLVNQRASRKNKLRQQILWGKEMFKNDKLLEKEDHIYVPGKF